MKFTNNWRATFIDATHQAVLTKPGRNQTRRIYLRYAPPFMKRIDCNGAPIQDSINPVSDETRGEILAACRERWG
jgi:hypothetical protein